VVTASLLGAALAAAVPAAAANPSCTDLFDPSSGSYVGTTKGTYLCDVPAGTFSYDYVIRGGYGGDPWSAGQNWLNALGAKISGSMTVTPGETLVIVVAGSGSPGPIGNSGSGGGGSSSIAQGGSPYAIAGGGGGAGSNGARENPDGGAAGAGEPGSSTATDGERVAYNVGDTDWVFGGTGASNATGGVGGSSVYGDSFGGPGGTGGGTGVNGSTAGGSAGGGGGGYGASGGAGGGFCTGPNAQYGGPGGYPNGGYGCLSGGGGGGLAGGGAGGTVNGTAAGGGGGSSLIPVGATAVNTGSESDYVPRVELVVGTPPTPPTPPGPAPAPTPATVTVSLSANGGSGGVPALTGPAGTWTAAPDGSSLTRAGYAFAGWNTAPDGSGLSFAPGAALQLTGDNTLYAQWSADSATGSGGGSSTGPSPSLQPTFGNGQIPPTGLPPAASLLLVDGVATGVTVAPNAPAVADATGLTISGPGFTMRLAGRGDDRDPLGLTPQQALILQSERLATRSAERGKDSARARVRPVAESAGSGFAATSPVQFYLLPSTFLGTITTDAEGQYDGSVPIPPGITPGDYTLQANGFAPDGAVRSLSIGVTVVASEAVAANRTARTRVLFAPLSAELSADAAASLRALVRRTGTEATRTTVVGFVQPVGTTRNDTSLSRARAKAVAQYLKVLGLQGTYSVRGDGRAEQPGPVSRRAEVTVLYTPR
jgi:uncharacterized repeat protein (TIGR02543 family)